ncbi:MAG: serine/threonine-protein kinase [Acidobacteria bacterium]|nr:serine/threonine-protein kinase [Acidobacteriota bacterium]
MFETVLNPVADVAGQSGEALTAAARGLVMRHFADYEVEDVLASGGTGVVFRARQRSLKRMVALKVLHAGRLASSDAVQRFRREAETAANLNHPNIVPIYEVGELEGQPFLSMQLIQGPSLAQKIGSGPLEPRMAARIVLRVAKALDYAHQRGVLHRDIKPSNLLLDADENPHLTDFGLALLAEHKARLTLHGELIGTPCYMSPEQASGRTKEISTRSDIYGLGAVLYECIAGRPPVVGDNRLETLRLVIESEPTAPSRLNAAVSRDLETICLKCLAKEPDRRYASASVLADDLERFLNGEPIAARHVGMPERMFLWARRKPVHAAFSLTLALAILATLVATSLWSRWSIARVSLQSAIITMRSGNPRASGWSTRALADLHEAGLLRFDRSFRDHVAASFEGLDAASLADREAAGIQQLLFLGEGTNVVFGGSHTNAILSLDQTLAPTLKPIRESPSKPIAFPQGVPFQILRDPSGDLIVWHPLERRSLFKLESPRDAAIDPQNEPLLAAGSEDTKRLSLVLPMIRGGALLGFWELPEGKMTRATELHARPSALALSGDGRLAAYGDSIGNVAVLDAESGATTCRLSLSRLSVLSLAFGQSARHLNSDLGYRDTLLAVGDEGGSIGIWDLTTCKQVAFCRGATYQVSALAFSPDRMLLASGGHGAVRLWDIATGRALLDVTMGDYCGALSFSPDGRMIAGSTEHGTKGGRVHIWSIQNGRGIRQLHGLASSVTRLAFSRDGTLLAGIGMGWEVGVWDLKHNRLLCVMEVARGFTADNCALAFSPDARLLAYAAGEEAQLWDVQTGKLMEAWLLPRGFTDALAFPATNKLFLFRTETARENAMPTSDFPYTNFSRVCRLRNLLSPQPSQPVREITEFNRHVFAAQASSDNRFFAVEGVGEMVGAVSRAILVIDAETGRTVWRESSTNKYSSNLFFSSSGATLAYTRKHTRDGVDWWRINLEAKTEPVRLVAGPYVQPDALGPNGRIWASKTSTPQAKSAVNLFRETDSLVTLGIYAAMDFRPQFDPTGRFLAWGNQDGSVSLCDLSEIQHRLGEYGVTVDIAPK